MSAGGERGLGETGLHEDVEIAERNLVGIGHREPELIGTRRGTGGGVEPHAGALVQEDADGVQVPGAARADQDSRVALSLDQDAAPLAAQHLDLGAIEKEELPKELQGKSKEEIEKYLKERLAERNKVLAEIRKISKDRDDYVRKEAAKKPGKRAAFDEWVVESLREDASEKGIEYEER